MIIFLFVFVLTIATGNCIGANDSAVDSLFNIAGSYYDDMQFSQALESYLKIEESGFVSGALYYNIGNCYFQESELGYAILYYLRAQRLEPTDDDIAGNLEFARQFMPVTLEGVRINPFTTFMDSVVLSFTLNTLAWISSALFILFIIFLCFVIYFQFRGIMIRSTCYILVTLLVISSVLTTYKYRTGYMTTHGVVVASEAMVYSGPGENHDLEFKGAAGLIFEIERIEDDYYLVIFENKRKGWINRDFVEII